MLQVFSDGGSRGNPGHAASAFAIFQDEKLLHANAQYLGMTTNNVAEYNGVLLALEWIVKNYKNEEIEFFMDSELVVKQLNGLYKIKNTDLKKLFLEIIEKISENNLKIKFIHVRREKNAFADKLVNEKLDDVPRS